jgi:hypothetical protein
VKALSVRQPWAWAIVCLPTGVAKDVENRSWSTGHRGPLAIHATKPASRADYERDCDAIEAICGERPPGYRDAVTSAVVGVVDLVDCRDGETDSAWAEDDAVWWFLARPRPCQPFAHAGARGHLFTVSDDLISKHVARARLKP